MVKVRDVILECSNRIRYCDTIDTWLVYNGGIWVRFPERTVKFFVRQWAYEMGGVVGAYSKVMRFILEAAKNSFSVGLNDLDRDKNLLNLENGVYDLDTYVLLPHEPEYLLTKKANVEYVEGVECPRWLEFLDAVFVGNKEVINFVQRAVGYTFSGYTDENCVFVLTGDEDGQDTFLFVLKDILGDYFANAYPWWLFSEKRNDRKEVLDRLFRLHGSRMTFIFDKRGEKWYSKNIKKVFKEEGSLTKNFLSQDFGFEVTAKIWVSTDFHINEFQDILGHEYKVFEIPFYGKLPEGKTAPGCIDWLLTERSSILNKERSGILNWALEGWRRWRAYKY